MAEFDELDVAELFGVHGAVLVRAARGLVRSEADAEDAVQDTMVAVLSAPHLLSVIENIGGWLYTLVQRRCVDILRGENVRRSGEPRRRPGGPLRGGARCRGAARAPGAR